MLLDTIKNTLTSWHAGIVRKEKNGSMALQLHYVYFGVCGKNEIEGL